MVHRPGQPPRPAHIPDQYHVKVAMPPMRSIKNEKFAEGIRSQAALGAVPAIEGLIQQEGLTGQVELGTHAAKYGYLVLSQCPQDFADKVKALPGVQSVDPAPAYYPMKRPGPGGLRRGPQ